MEDRPSLGFRAYGPNPDERACERKYGVDVYVEVVLMSMREGGLILFPSGCRWRIERDRGGARKPWCANCNRTMVLTGECLMVTLRFERVAAFASWHCPSRWIIHLSRLRLDALMTDLQKVANIKWRLRDPLFGQGHSRLVGLQGEILLTPYVTGNLVSL